MNPLHRQWLVSVSVCAVCLLACDGNTTPPPFSTMLS